MSNTSKKWLIGAINASNFICPGTGLIALYMVLKDKRKQEPTPPVEG